MSIDTSGLPKRRPAADHEHVQHEGLMRELTAHIRFHGPLSVKDFMAAALTHPKFGYYVREEVFGRAGDFTTSPEVSQTFGELLGVWCVATWQALGSPAAVRLTELGPGRGTLMADVLRSSAAFPSFHGALSVHLVEVSPRLREAQARSLGCDGVGDGHGRTGCGVGVSWHGGLEEVPADAPLLLLGHEFLDALPTHQFVRTAKGWRERMVDLREQAGSRSSPVEEIPMPSGEGAGEGGGEEDAPRDLDGDERHLEFVLAPSPTPASAVLTGKLFSGGGGGVEGSGGAQGGGPHQVEVCPAAQSVVQQVAQRLTECRGAALFIDYGADETPADTLRGISRHQYVHPLHRPGEVDLSVDVDFGALRRAALEAAPELRIPPLVEQRHFLGAMGIETRVNALLRRASSVDQQREILASAQRLIDSPGMGSAYKALAMLHADIADAPGFPPADATDDTSRREQ